MKGEGQHGWAGELVRAPASTPRNPEQSAAAGTDHHTNHHPEQETDQHMARTFVVQTGRGRDACDSNNDDGSGNPVVQATFDVEGLPDSTRHPSVRHDCGAEGRVSRGQGGTHEEGVPRTHSQHDNGGNGAQRNGQRKSQSQQPQVKPAVRSEIGDPHPAGVGEQHPDQRDFSDDLDQVGIQTQAGAASGPAT